MQQHFILDTGPLVALLDKSDTWHEWAVAQWSNAEPPLLSYQLLTLDSDFLIYRKHGNQAIPCVQPLK